jgi:hypothetical protein
VGTKPKSEDKKHRISVEFNSIWMPEIDSASSSSSSENKVST